MKHVTHFILFSCYSLALCSSTVAIQELSYDVTIDSLAIKIKRNGVCLSPQFKLEPIAHKDFTYRFYLHNTNKTPDPCNGNVEQTLNFPLDFIQNRPAQILVSTNQDGDSPYEIVIGAHERALVFDAKLSADFKHIIVNLLSDDKTTPSGLYVDWMSMCRSRFECEITVRQKHSLNDNLRIKEFKLPLNIPFKPQNILIEDSNQKRLRFAIP